MPSDDVTFGTEMRDERCSIKLNSTGEVREVDAGDIEKVRCGYVKGFEGEFLLLCCVVVEERL